MAMMDIARRDIGFLPASQWLRARASIVLAAIMRRRARRYKPPALSDDSRQQLQRERLQAQHCLDRLNLAARRPL
jgi:hypothetical protein